jgi:hypothetical protein
MPGPLPGQQVTAGTIFGLSRYGTSLYGIGIPPEYLAEPMTAASNSYTSVLVTWNQPSGTIFRYRLLRNRYGFPVSENDGDILYDTVTYPGNSYTDLDISPGTYHYYGLYVLADIGDNLWIRSGFAGCLAVQDYGCGQWLLDLLPEYFTTIPQTGGALTDDASGNSQLQLFLNVLGWALDYLRTQYASYADHLNDAWFVPLDDLWNLAAQVGLSFSPDVPAYTVRKATENFAHVTQERGTLPGIAEEITLRTGYGADIHMGPNILLDDDQAQILSPLFLQYVPTRSYHKDECCWVPDRGLAYPWLWDGDGWWFRSLADGNLGNTPPPGGTSNTWWQALYDSDDFLATQHNIRTGNPGTWEILDTGAPGYLPLPGSATQGLGVLTPPPVSNGGSSYAWNCLRFYNRQAAATTLWCRSVSRRTTDLGQIPDPSFEAGTTIAPPARNTSTTWVPSWWPRTYVPNWMDDDGDDIRVQEYWTAANAALSREDTTAHTGSWAVQVTPSGSAVPAQPPPAPQYPDPGFESAAITSWAAAQCTISQSSATAHSGAFSLLIMPQYTTSGSVNTPSGNPSVTGPQIQAIPGAADTAAVWCLGTQGPVHASVYPYVIAAIQYYDPDGNVLLTAEAASVLLSATWTQLTVTATAPAGAATKALILLSDPAHTANINNWYADDISWTWAVTETWADITLSSPWVTCPGNAACTGSAWYQAGSAGSVITASLQFYDDDGNLLQASAGAGTTGTAGTWVNPQCSGTAPAAASYAALQLVITSPVQVSYLDDTTISAGLTPAPQPDPLQAVADGIPVPWVPPGSEWDPATRYATGDIVSYGNQPFTALRASRGSIPPANNTATADWAPLSQSPRIRLCLSGYTSQNLSNSGTYSYAVTPFIEWYDAQGQFIARVFARSAAGNGTVSQPAGMAYDSFTTQSVIASPGTPAGSLAPSQWTASFWNNTSMSGTPVLARTDPAVSFTWNGTPPGPGVAASGWSASWVSSFTAPAAGSYGFQLQAGQGGSRLIVNGQTLIDNWAQQSAAALTAAMTLTAGQPVTVEIDYWTPPAPQSSYDLVTYSYDDFDLDCDYQPGRYLTEWILAENNSNPLDITAISPGQVLQVSGSAVPDGDCTGILTVAWLDGRRQPFRSIQQELADEPFTVSFTAPDRAAYALVTFTSSGASIISAGFPPLVRCHFHGIQVTVQVLPAGATQDSLAFSNITVPAVPPSATQFSYTLAGRRTDDEQSSWTVPAGNWTVGGFAGGSAWPAAPGAQAIALLTTQPANTSLGVTFRSMPQGGAYAGIVFRYASTSSYWRSDQVQLGYVSGGTYTLIAAHAQPFQPGDRMVVVLNGTSVTVYRNGTQVNSAVSSFNSTAAQHGIINDITGLTEAAAGDPLRKTPIRSRARMPSRRGTGKGT